MIVNSFCSNGDWNIVKGDWSHDSTECSLSLSSDADDGDDVVWLGTNDMEHVTTQVAVIIHLFWK